METQSVATTISAIRSHTENEMKGEGSRRRKSNIQNKQLENIFFLDGPRMSHFEESLTQKYKKRNCSMNILLHSFSLS